MLVNSNQSNMNNLNDLKIQNKAVDLSIEIYNLTNEFPEIEKFGLINQMRRASVSIASNIAEGAGRNSKKEFKHFLAISHGSSYELLTQLQISFKLKFCKEDVFIELKTKIIEIQKMNFALQQKLITKD